VSNPESIGALAEAAIRRGGVPSRVLALSASAYWRIGCELVWIGESAAAPHPRAITTKCDAPGNTPRPWRPRPPRLSGDLRPLRWRLRAALDEIVPEARGLAVMLRGAAPDAPFDLASKPLRRFASACGQDDIAAAFDSGSTLIGLGPGLTPSGDDFIGAALFAKRALAAGYLAPKTWLAAGRRLAVFAKSRTTTVSAVLLADLAAGRSFAPLHDLVEAIEKDDALRARSALRRLVAIGHSSGWDMAAGFAVGLLGRSAIARRRA